MVGRNGAKAARQEAQKDREFEAEREALNAQAVDPQMREEYARARAELLEQLTDTELEDPSKQLLMNLTSPDFILANFSPEDYHELRYDLKILKEYFLAIHPAKESPLQGPVRRFVYDEDTPEARLTALTQQQELDAKQFFRGIRARMTRGKEGFQQEMMAKNIEERHASVDRGDDSGGGLLGRR